MKLRKLIPIERETMKYAPPPFIYERENEGRCSKEEPNCTCSDDLTDGKDREPAGFGKGY